MENILIVDDQACIRKLVCEELFLEGYRAEGVGDPDSLRRRLTSWRPDLVLLDLYLDGPCGFNILSDIKKEHPHLPVVIFTAYDSYKDDPRLAEADGYVIKSVSLDELKEKVSALLKNKPAAERKIEADDSRPGSEWRLPLIRSEAPRPKVEASR
jgi:two-component system response regulator (stage 0 sporulation protein F)